MAEGASRIGVWLANSSETECLMRTLAASTAGMKRAQHGQSGEPSGPSRDYKAEREELADTQAVPSFASFSFP